MSNRNKNILLGILIVGVLAMTVAFAALTTRLSLNGTANVAATSWNIHFDSWTSVTQSTVDNHQNTAEINESQITQTTAPNITKIDNVNVTLKQPGDYIKYNFVIENEGTIDGKLDNFTKTVTPTNDVVGLTVNCYESNTREGTPLTTNYVLRAGETIYCYFEVKYNDATNTSTAGSNQVYEQSAINASISANWTWIQDDATSAATGGGNSGGNEQPALTWDNYITPSQASGATLPSNTAFYIQQNNTSTSYSEVCGVFSNGTVCVTNSTTGRSSDFASTSKTDNITTTQALEATGLQGYALSKAEEMLTKGAASCMIGSNGVYCWDSDIECCVYRNGGVDCYASDGSNSCDITSNGRSECY